jgi:hypothetical protein
VIATNTIAMTTRGNRRSLLGIETTATHGSLAADLATPENRNQTNAAAMLATTLAGRSVNVTSGRATPIRATCSRAT